MQLSYDSLHAEVVRKGLFKRAYGYYGALFAFICVGTAGSLYLITVSPSPYLQIPNAVFLAFMLVQAGMLGHDFSHEQVFHSHRANRLGGALMWGLFGGLSEDGWYEKHNAHHTHVNWVNHDPDVDMPFIFSSKQLPPTHPIVHHYLRYQHIVFFAVLPLIYFSMLKWSWGHLLRMRSWRALLDVTLIAAHFGILFFLIFWYLPLPLALAFLIILSGTSGAYMSSVFAPNHKGETVIGGGETPPWTTQITSTRNVRPSPLTFFLMGGLNFQIEHHLFTSMARCRYWQAQPLVQQFCSDNSIPYHETSWVGSMKEIYRSLRIQARNAS